jgi:hypothetical protein
MVVPGSSGSSSIDGTSSALPSLHAASSANAST